MSKRGGGKVGYKKPPPDKRFKPGQSGNPRGRPKGSTNLATAIRKAMARRIHVTERGRTKSISKTDAMATQLINKAIQDPKLLAVVLRAAGAESDGDAGPDRPESVIQREDELVMESIVRRIRQMDEVPSSSIAQPAPEPITVPIEEPK